MASSRAAGRLHQRGPHKPSRRVSVLVLMQRMENNHIPPDEYLTMTQAVALIPGRPHPSAVWRWCRKGIVARNGDRVHLRHGRAGRRVFTTATWLREFFDAVAAADCEAFDSGRRAAAAPRRRVSVRSPAERERAIRRAEEELRRMGI